MVEERIEVTSESGRTTAVVVMDMESGAYQVNVHRDGRQVHRFDDNRELELLDKEG